VIVVAAALAGSTDLPSAYARAMESHTAELRLYDGWYTALLVRGTRMDETVQQLQGARRERITGEPDPSRPPPGFEVVLSVSSQFPEELRFSADGSTPWTLHAFADGKPCAAPAAIDTVKKPSALDHALFPQLTRWDLLVRVRWDDQACGSAIPDALRFSSARAHGDLRWEDSR
jgi:hypothetical protein